MRSLPLFLPCGSRFAGSPVRHPLPPGSHVLGHPEVAAVSPLDR